MKKSIYEEMLEIIDRNIFELPMGFGVLYEIRKKVEQAFEQAQKQKELLDYYSELVETIEILERDYNYGLFKFNGIKYTYNKIMELEKEIRKELENDQINL